MVQLSLHTSHIHSYPTSAAYKSASQRAASPTLNGTRSFLGALEVRYSSLASPYIWRRYTLRSRLHMYLDIHSARVSIYTGDIHSSMRIAPASLP